MTKRKKSRSSRPVSKPRPIARRATAPHPDADLPLVIRLTGTGLRYRRGDLVIDHKAFDPDDPARRIAQVRVNPVYHRLRASGGITAEQSLAADKYGELCDLEAGATMGGGAGHSAALAPWQRSPTDTQINLVTKLRHMRGIWGNRARRIVDMLVLENLSKEQISEKMGQNDQRTLGEIVAALDRCAEEWGIQARRQRSSTMVAADGRP